MFGTTSGRYEYREDATGGSPAQLTEAGVLRPSLDFEDRHALAIVGGQPGD